ncbi:RNA polymerase primary sigma factor [Ruminococcaceae bacterium YRB3002]|nr:RNA polymerase primary sigma factor [Ruminococcaceae bacterium YRB3002]
MNENLVYEMIKPYVKDNTLTYTVFFRLFDVLQKPEQYQIINLIEDKFNIELVDDTDIDVSALDDEEIDENEFNELYDKGIFANKAISECDGLDYRQANEILCALIHEGNEAAKQALCIKNQKLVWKYAYAYYKFYGNKLDMEELAQAGYIGLLKGADRFDLSRGNTFSTYVVYWIKQSIERELIDKGFTIRLPVHMFEKVKKLTKLDTKYDEMGYSFDERVNLIAIDMEETPEYIIELFTYKFRFFSLSSLDVPVGEEEETPLSDFIENKTIESPEDVADKKELRILLEKALATLTKREERVIRLRFGFDDGTPKTLEEIGKIEGVTRERIRQIEAKALRKLSRSSITRQHLGGFYDS